MIILFIFNSQYRFCCFFHLVGMFFFCHVPKKNNKITENKKLFLFIEIFIKLNFKSLYFIYINRNSTIVLIN